MVGETTVLPLYRDHRAPTVRSPDSLAPSPPPPLNTPSPPPPTIGTVESAPVSSGACTKGIMTFPRSATTKGDQQWGGGRRTLIRQRPTSSERLHRPSEPRESRTKPCLVAKSRRYSDTWWIPTVWGWQREDVSALSTQGRR